MSVIRSASFAFFGASVLLGAVAACESAINLDVNYRDASPTGDASEDGGEAGVPQGVELEACPCDESQGFGCCVTSNGPSFCTLDSNQCGHEKGVFMKCFRPSAVAESACCWHAGDKDNPPVAAYAGYCDAGPAACVDNNDCRGAQAGPVCITRLCGGQTIGQCGAAGGPQPPCP